MHQFKTSFVLCGGILKVGLVKELTVKTNCRGKNQFVLLVQYSSSSSLYYTLAALPNLPLLFLKK